MATRRRAACVERTQVNEVGTTVNPTANLASEAEFALVAEAPFLKTEGRTSEPAARRHMVSVYGGSPSLYREGATCLPCHSRRERRHQLAIWTITPRIQPCQGKEAPPRGDLHAHLDKRDKKHALE